jgi:hypothetical protein
VGRDINGPDRHQPIALGQRKFRIKQAGHDGERAGCGGDADSQTEHAGDAQARIAHEHAPGQHHIDP